MREINYTLLEKNYIQPDITQKTIDGILHHPQFFRGHVRTSVGKLYTGDEFAKRSNEVLAKKLP